MKACILTLLRGTKQYQPCPASIGMSKGCDAVTKHLLLRCPFLIRGLLRFGRNDVFK